MRPCSGSEVAVLQIVSYPLDDVALVAAPATGAVAVVDAAGRAILEGLRDGRDERELAISLAATRGIAADSALGRVAG